MSLKKHRMVWKVCKLWNPTERESVMGVLRYVTQLKKKIHVCTDYYFNIWIVITYQTIR